MHNMNIMPVAGAGAAAHGVVGRQTS